jgi:hypothetical protein
MHAKAAVSDARQWQGRARCPGRQNNVREAESGFRKCTDSPLRPITLCVTGAE